MRVHELTREQVVPHPLHETFAFFAQLTPEPIAMGTGTVVEYRLRLHVAFRAAAVAD